MSDESKPNDGDYRNARQISAGLLIAAVVLVVVADSLQFGRDADPLVLSAILVTAAGLLAVDLPGVRR